METLYKLGAKPRRRQNLTKWMTKHLVSGNHCSLNLSVPLAIDRMAVMDAQ